MLVQGLRPLMCQIEASLIPFVSCHFGERIERNKGRQVRSSPVGRLCMGLTSEHFGSTVITLCAGRAAGEPGAKGATIRGIGIVIN